ncbi:MAG: hypothetical protein FWC43_14685 [Planctomycetaceae bacterium]|nr:hypothetical protein [Planctomycetaceae bacterium]
MSEIIDISFSIPAGSPEPAVPIVLKGEHLRFIGWKREYTLIVDQDVLTIEGPFQDDNPNAKEFYQVSRQIASRWLEVRYGWIRLHIPGRGRWGIDISGNPNFEIQTARLLTWMSLEQREAAVSKVEEELTQILYHWPTIHAGIQLLTISLPAFLVAIFGSGSPIAAGANGLLGLLFGLVFIAIGVLKSRFGLWLGTLLNLFLLGLPIFETFLVGERSSLLGFSFPFFVPFCLTPTAIFIPLAMSAYGYVLLEHPRFRRMIRR